MLSAAAKNALPESIDVGAQTIQQTLFPGDTSVFRTAGTFATTSEFRRFAVNAEGLVAARVDVASTGQFVDAAVAIYDADGNRLGLADQDGTPLSPANETLQLTLEPGTVYILGLSYVGNFPNAGTYDVTVSLPGQAGNRPIQIDPATGVGEAVGEGPADGFSSARDVDFYPVRFLNGRAAGSVTVSGTAPDVQVAGQVWRLEDQSGNVAARAPGDKWWRQVAAGSGDPVALSVPTPSGGNLTDGSYVLAVAPKDFTAPPRSYRVDVSASLIGPGAIGGDAFTELGTLGILEPGIAGANVTGFISGATASTYHFRAAQTGKLQVRSTGGVPLVSVERVGDGAVSTVRSLSGAGLLVFDVDVVAGEEYAVRFGQNGGAGVIFTGKLAQAYVPEAVSVAAASASLPGVVVGGASGGKFYRLTLPPQREVLSVRVAPSAGSGAVPRIALLGSGMSVPITKASAAGEAVELFLTSDKFSGLADIDLFVSSDVEGAVDVGVAAVDVPRTLALSAAPTRRVDLITGDASAVGTLGGAGSPIGMKFWNMPAAGTAALSLTPAGAGKALLAEYVEQDGVLQLVGFTLPGAAGIAQRTSTLQSERFVALVAIALTDVPDDVTVASNGAAPKGVGVAMASEPVPKLNPGDPNPVPPYQQVLKIRNWQMRSGEERDVWETLLPYNAVAAVPTVRFGPANAGGSLALNVSVLDENNNVLASYASSPGQVVENLAVDVLAMPANAGRKVRFLVESVTGQPLGDGIYTLELKVATTNSAPFQVLESSFIRNNVYQPNSNYLPIGEPIQELSPFTFSKQSSFTSSLPYNTGGQGNQGAIDVFRFDHDDTPFAVWTEDITAGLNTSLKLYRGVYSGANLVRLDELKFTDGAGGFTSVPGNLDYFQSDRSVVDAKVVMTNTDLMRSYGAATGVTTEFYAVVKNEEGTQGSYRLKVGAIPTVTDGAIAPAAYYQSEIITEIWIDARTGVSRPDSISNNGLARLVTPASLLSQPRVTVTTPAGPGHTYALSVYDEAGNLLPSPGAISTATGSATFQLSGLQAKKNYLMRINATSYGGNLGVTASANVIGMFTAAGPNDSHRQLTKQTINTYEPYEPYGRAAQQVDGTFGVFDLFFGSGLLSKEVFWVSQPGLATFNLHTTSASNVVFSLYRGYNTGSESGHFWTGHLADYTAASNPQNGLTLTEYVLPGMYYLTVEGTYTGGGGPFGVEGTVDVDAHLPAGYAQVVTLDPNTGSTIAPNQWLQDENQAPNPFKVPTAHESWETTFYKLKAPGAVSSPLTVGVLSTKDPFPTIRYQGSAYISTSRQRLDGTYAFDWGDFVDYDGTTDDINAEVIGRSPAKPGETYVIAVNRDRLSTLYHVGLSTLFSVPQSGTPDLVVDSVALTPDNGQTKVTVTLRNNGYAPAGLFRTNLQFSNYLPPYNETKRTVAGLGAFTTRTFSYIWHPDNTLDKVTFAADIDNQIEERSETNNAALAALTKRKPDVAMSLVDGRYDASGGPDVWGRYLSGVPMNLPIQIDPSDPDGDADIWQTFIQWPNTTQAYGIAGSATQRVDHNPGQFAPTSASNPNVVRYYAVDVWGLRGPDHFVYFDVAPKPSFYTRIDWDKDALRYRLRWENTLIDYDKTVSQIVGASLPLIGDKKNTFLIKASAEGTAGLDPTQPVSIPLTAVVKLEGFGKTFIDETWTGSKALSDNFTVYSTLEVSPRTLDVTAAAASFQLRNLNLLNIRTPKIPLFSYGIPGVAAISANFSLGLKMNLEAGVKVGLDPSILNNPGLPTWVGIMSPTFVKPSIIGSAYISGDVELFGFDIASLEGHLDLGIHITIGLDNADRSAVFPIEDVPGRLAVKVQGSIGFGMSAELLGFEIWDWSPDPYFFDIADTSTHGGIITRELGEGGGAPALARLNAFLAGDLQALAAEPGSPFGQPNVRAGSSPVGPYQVAATPQLTIDPTTGDALTVQVVDTDPSDTETLSGLVFANRHDGVWSGLSPMDDQSHDVANPVLALSRDGDWGASVLVYEVGTLPGPVASQTMSQRLASRDLRYRYWDGNGWGPEMTLADAAGGDSDAVTAFNLLGQGVAAWVHNTSADPMGADAYYARDAQEIHVAAWDANTHTFGAPTVLTADGVSDGQPAVFADDEGNLYVVWTRDNGDGTNAVWYSVNASGAGWSAPAQLSITGLAPGGKFGGIAVGAEQPGRVNVLFNYRTAAPDGQVDSKLYSRATTVAGFTASAGVEVVAEGATFSHLRVTNMPFDGALVATWQQSDGVVNEIYSSVLRPTGAAWSEPARVTSSDVVEKRPALAIEPDGTFKVIYEFTDPAAPSLAPSLAAQGLVAGDIPTVAGVGAAAAPELPDIAIRDSLTFKETATAVQGGTTRGTAVIVNRGRSPVHVTVGYAIGPDGSEIVLAQQVILLSPGASYLAGYDFPVAEGDNYYSIIATPDGLELGPDTDNVTRYVLASAPDVQALKVYLVNPAQAPGGANDLLVELRNNSSAALPDFDLTIYANDPLFPQSGAFAIATRRITGMQANEEQTEGFTIPAVLAAGRYVYTAVVDASDEIAEAVEGNNQARLQFEYGADPRITNDVPSGPPQVIAEVLNASGIDNVNVFATIRNLGPAPASGLSLHLLRSLDGGAWVEVGSMTLPELASGEYAANTSFVASALAGENRFRLVLAGSETYDTNLTNNAGEAVLYLNGLAELSVATVAPVLALGRVVQGGSTTASITVTNNGILGADNVLVELLARPVGGGTPFTLGSTRLARVDALSAAPVSIPLDTGMLAAGDYELYVVVDSGDEILEPEDVDNTSLVAPFTVVAPGSVERRLVFYNNSWFDGKDVAANASDDVAIATGKVALLPGGASVGFPNYTTYSKGLNGIMIDVAGTVGTLTAADFTLRLGNADDLGAWTVAPAPLAIATRPIDGGFTRVTLIFADKAILNTWLEVTIHANGNTGLLADDTFYFGNLVGDTSADGVASDGVVDSADLLGVRANLRNFRNRAGVTDGYDLNRDSLVDATDAVIARDAAVLNGGASLRLPFTPTPPLPPLPLQPGEPVTGSESEVLVAGVSAESARPATSTSTPPPPAVAPFIVVPPAPEVSAIHASHTPGYDPTPPVAPMLVVPPVAAIAPRVTVTVNPSPRIRSAVAAPIPAPAVVSSKPVTTEFAPIIQRMSETGSAPFIGTEPLRTNASDGAPDVVVMTRTRPRRPAADLTAPPRVAPPSPAPAARPQRHSLFADEIEILPA